ncbi:hypothetical protein [Paenibacillus naphthalenovorans]|uniref:hypothetical protein n=1 Tax=Paenibacillus naphthalenovorans TaxID=162209 RepID=UPI003D26D5B8
MNAYTYAGLIENPENAHVAQQIISDFVEGDVRMPGITQHYQWRLRQLEGMGEKVLAETLRRDYAYKLRGPGYEIHSDS